MTSDIVTSPATRCPPGPRLPAVLQSWLYARRRAGWLHKLRDQHGDVFMIRVKPYADRLVVLSNPEHVRQVFGAAATEVHGGEGNHLIAGLMGPSSVMVADEAEHARLRRLLLPAFTGAALRGYRAAITEIAESELETWADQDDPVQTLARMNAMALEMILGVVFGVTDSHRRHELAPLLEQVVTIHPLVLAGLNWPRLRGIGPWARYRHTEARINGLLYAEITQRRRDPQLAQRRDVLSRMLAVGTGDDEPLTDTEVRDQLITLLLAGHETTASALAWTLYELAAHPLVQDRARRAVLDGDDRYIDALLRESMRVHTVIGGTYRRLTTDMQFGDWLIPAGVYVTTSSLITHRDPDLFDDPLAFRPERFLDGSVPSTAWYAFGGGVRRCPGAQFALLEGQLVLHAVLTRYTLSLPTGVEPAQHAVRNITHVPGNGAWILVRRIR
ncbi:MULTISPECIES: cytochrome P450 [unclassified Nocardia]|uniref:cytochrome P450 n=1 Tax=unclassified Nocardia TaxID=2637762 RepID=UPI001CE443FF|nr:MULTISPECIES: cytochrome P450 [unclassified Nocardia]